MQAPTRDRDERDRTTELLWLGLGAGATVLARRLFARLLLVKLRRDARALSEGDYRPLLGAFAEDAVLNFNDSEHRWAGVHRGKPAIERFLQAFVAARIQGEIVDLFVSGAPWRISLIVRFDDHAHDEQGEELYRNRTLLLARTRWGKIVRQEDFYEDTERIVRFDRRLRELGR